MTILITGASSGIGRHLATHLCQEGNHVWGLARTEKPLAELKRESHGRFDYLPADVSSLASLQKAYEMMKRNLDLLDAVICCAGVQGAMGETLETNPEEWAKTIGINLIGTYHTLHTFSPLVIKSGRRGKVLCFSGGGATSPRANFSAYASSKAGVVRLVETLAEEWSSKKIDINAIAPGAIPTRLTDQIISSGPAVVGKKEYTAALKLKEEGDRSIQDVVELVDFLLSRDSDGISGRLISAKWDRWREFASHKEEIAASDLLTLRRITPKERGLRWG